MKTLIAANLDRILEVKCLSYAELSRISRVSKGHLSDLRHGNISAPSIWTLKRIADALGCKVDDLITTKRHYHISQVDKMVDGWISVDDRLPDDDDRLILVANANNKTVMSAIGIGDLFIGFGPNGMINLDGITHWMSLPEPPMQNESST